MSLRYQGARNWVFAHKKTSILAVLAVILGGFLYFSLRGADTEPVFATVTRGIVAQIVSVTGKVKPASEVNLSFEKGGRIAAVYHNVGEQVKVGALLVSLENGDMVAQLAQAKAIVRAQEAKLAELKAGPRLEDVSLSEVDVANALNDVLNDIRSSYVNADDAIRNKVDQLFSNPKSTTPQFNFVIGDSRLKNDVESGRAVTEAILISWSASMDNIRYANANDVYQYILTSKQNLRAVQDYLDKVASAVNTLTTSSTLSQTAADAYKAAILSGRTNVTNALDGLTASEERLRTAQSKLALKQAGASQEQIAAQAAEVDAASANVMNLQAQLAKTIIRSPISGIVTKQDARAGEIAGVGKEIVSVISADKYEIEANVPEADIAKIKLGDMAQVTLDAYGNDALFAAVVSKIDPAETIIEGVATYKTTLQFKDSDLRIKPGMTANTDIAGAKRENVLFVSGRAITSKGILKTVNVIEGDITRETEVVTGLRGSNGDVEVVSGLKEGDRVKTGRQ